MNTTQLPQNTCLPGVTLSKLTHLLSMNLSPRLLTNYARGTIIYVVIKSFKSCRLKSFYTRPFQTIHILLKFKFVTIAIKYIFSGKTKPIVKMTGKEQLKDPGLDQRVLCHKKKNPRISTDSTGTHNFLRC